MSRTASMLKQSVCIPILKPADMPLASFITLVAELGFGGVEIWNRDGSFDEIVSLCRQHSLTFVSMCGHSRRNGGFNERAKHDSIRDELASSIELAVKNSIPTLICFSGDRQPGMSEEDAIAVTVEGLQKIAPLAESKGVTLNMELLNSKVDHPGYQADRTWWGAEVIKRVNSPRVKLLYDIYHMQIMEGDVIRTIRENIAHIGHIHTAGNPGRQDLDDEQELNYRVICRAIASSGYTGWIGHEFRPKKELRAALKQAIDVCSV